MQNFSKRKRQQKSLPWLPDQWHKMHIAASLRRLRFLSQQIKATDFEPQFGTWLFAVNALPVNPGFPVALEIQKASKTPTELNGSLVK